MSNYPPGVSGNEYEIAGPDNEWEEEFECSNEKFEYVRISPHSFKWASDLGKKIHTTSGKQEVMDNLYHYLSILNVCFSLSEMSSDVVTEKCNFSGVVLKQSYRSLVWWSCPVCAKEYEEELEDYYYE